MTDNQLTAARGALKLIELREANRISHLSDVIPEYSDRFNDKIERLIASERKREASVLKLPLKKKILILVAAMVIALLTATSCVFGAEIKDFIIEVHSNTVILHSDGSGAHAITAEYRPSYLPDGYIHEKTIRSSSKVTSTWQRGKNTITITQATQITEQIKLDLYGIDYRLLDINGMEIHSLHENRSYYCIWTHDGYTFTLRTDTDLKLDDVKDIIRSISK